jgi:hypothetical protein
MLFPKIVQLEQTRKGKTPAARNPYKGAAGERVLKRYWFCLAKVVILSNQ